MFNLFWFKIIQTEKKMVQLFPKDAMFSSRGDWSFKGCKDVGNLHLACMQVIRQNRYKISPLFMLLTSWLSLLQFKKWPLSYDRWMWSQGKLGPNNFYATVFTSAWVDDVLIPLLVILLSHSARGTVVPLNFKTYIKPHKWYPIC